VNTVAGFNHNANGTLTPPPGSPFAVGGASGHLVYVANADPNAPNYTGFTLCASSAVSNRS